VINYLNILKRSLEFPTRFQITYNGNYGPARLGLVAAWKKSGSRVTMPSKPFGMSFNTGTVLIPWVCALKTGFPFPSL